MLDERIPTYWDISSEQWTDLGKKVEKANGRLIILVHPWIDSYAKIAQKGYFPLISNLLKKSRIPIIVLEEYFQFERRKKEFPELHAHLIIPTIKASPNIVWKLRPGQTPKTEPGGRAHLAKLIRQLKSLGVQSVQIGGMYAGFRLSEVAPAVELHERKKTICEYSTSKKDQARDRRRMCWRYLRCFHRIQSIQRHSTYPRSNLWSKTPLLRPRQNCSEKKRVGSAASKNT